MRSTRRILFLVLATAIAASACGDKLLHLSRMHRALAMHGSVVVYSRPNSLLGNAASLRLESAFQKAGHSVRLISNDRELDAAIRWSPPDVVIVDIADIAAVRELALVRDTVVPVVASTDRQVLHDAKRQYPAVIQSPAKPGKFVDAVDQAIDAKMARQDFQSHR